MSEPEAAYAFASGVALDRASESREQAAVLAQALADPLAVALVVRPDGSVLGDDSGARWVPIARMPAEKLNYLGQFDRVPRFAVAADACPAIAAQTPALDLRRVAASWPGPEASIAAFARALLHWQSRQRHCGRCGAATEIDHAGHRARCTEAACGETFFPRTDPAIIVAVDDGERILLGRQASWPEGRYSTLAGFVEPGESLEDAVRREVAEETGVRVGRCRYVGSQPWPFPASLMVGFEAEAEAVEVRLGPELSDARWFSVEDIDEGRAAGTLGLSPGLSISRHLIARWYRARSGRELAP